MRGGDRSWVPNIARSSLNRTQWLVLITIAIAWTGSVLALTDLYRNEVFGLVGGLLFQLAISAVYGFFALAAIRRWRWAFFVLMAVFLLNALSVVQEAQNAWFWVVRLSAAPNPVGAKFAELQIESVLPLFLVNLLAFVTGLAMLVGLVRRGIWGSF
jgi:hypothetical protein